MSAKRNGTWETVGIVFGLAIVAAVLCWFSYQKGVMDQDFKDETWISNSVHDFWQEGYTQGRLEQRGFDLTVCQKHSIHPRLEDHCVAPL